MQGQIEQFRRDCIIRGPIGVPGNVPRVYASKHGGLDAEGCFTALLSAAADVVPTG